MINSWRHSMTLLICGVMIATSAVAQELIPTKDTSGAKDDLGDVSDKFQESFFEALKQKAITNYEKAIDALETCINMDPSQVVLYEELGKNYLELKQYSNAEENFKKVLESKPKDRFTLELLYEVYFKQRKYTESVTIVEQLVGYDAIFKEQLANLYFLEKRYDDALIVLDELTDELGNDKYRDSLRKRITLKITNPSNQIERLQQKVASSPDNEQNYLNLIYLYSQAGQKDEAYKVAQELLKKKPNSELVHLALYKFYLNDNKTKKAIASMKKVLSGNTVDEESKYKVISDFLLFVKENPEYETELDEVIKMFSKGKGEQGKIFTEIGHFYYKKDQKELALNYYERGIKTNANDFGLLKRILLLQLDLKRYEKAKVGSEFALEMYPAHPIFYLINGASLINSNESKEALEILSTGIDYIIDDIKMETDFYNEISRAYQQLGNTTKASEYKEKALQLQKKS